VLEHVRVVVGGQQRIDRDGNQPRMQRPQKRRRKIDGVVQAQEHALIAAQPKSRERGGDLLYALRKLTVRKRLLVVDIGELGGAVGIARQQVRGKVEAGRRRCAQRPHFAFLLVPV